MIYIVLLVAVTATVFFGILSRKKTRQTVLFTCVVASYTLAMCCFLLYLCKDAFHLSVFLEFFPIPRQLVLDFYAMNISKMTIISVLNLFCAVFLFCNVLFAATFSTLRRPGRKRTVFLASGVYFLLQGLLLDPYVYRGLYSLLYPTRFSSLQLESFFQTLSTTANVLNCLILSVCAGVIIFQTAVSPNIRLLKIGLSTVSLSYTLMVLSYIFFFNRLPGQLIKYSKAADIVTYRTLTNNSQMNLFQYFPYVVFVFVLLFAGSVLLLTFTERRLNSDNLEVTRNIRAANMSSRLFCHYMKNEILAISAELEEVPLTQETREPIESVMARCDTIYQKLDGIHKSIRDNTMSLRQVSACACVRSALAYVETSNRLEGVEVSFDSPQEDAFVLVDPVYFEQALIELFYNASDAMLQSETKRLTVRVNHGMRWVTVNISDTGCGIEKKNLKNIFTPLFSTHAMTKNWGIGLSLTHRILTAFNGRITVHSEVGTGTTFELLLPSSNPGVRQQPADQQTQTEGGTAL